MFTKRCYAFDEFAIMREQDQLTKLDKMIEHIKKNKKVYTQLVVTLAFIGLSGNMVYAASRVDALGMKIVRNVSKVGKWVFLAKGASESIKEGMQGNIHGASKIATSYLLLYGLLLALPIGFDWIEESFR